jgi:hypothetical protein
MSIVIGPFAAASRRTGSIESSRPENDLDRSGQPSRFLALVARLLLWLTLATVLGFATGGVAAYLAPDDYCAGRDGENHVHSCPRCVARDFRLGIDERSRALARWSGATRWPTLLKAAAPIGAAFTLMCLLTGSFWGGRCGGHIGFGTRPHLGADPVPDVSSA